MNQTIQLSEFSNLPLETAHGLTSREFDYLCHLRQDHGVPFFDEVRVGSQWRLRSRQYVGAIALPGGRTLELLPKISTVEDPSAVRRNLMHMLSVTGMLPALQGELGVYSQSENLTEAYLSTITRRAWSLLHQGVLRDYRRRDLTTPYIKGRWLVSRQIARNPGRYDRHDVNIDLFTLDTDHNRCLKAAMRVVTSSARTGETRRQAHSLHLLLDQVTDVPLTASLCERLHFDRRTAAWQSLFVLVTQFVKRQLSDLASGAGSVGPAWLFDMNELFELYVAQAVRRLCPKEVHVQGPRRHFLRTADGEPRFGLIPDIVIGKRTSPDLVMDTKWKRLGQNLEQSIAIADLRQAFTYGKIYRVPRVILLYPTAYDCPRQLDLESNEAEQPVQITLAEIPVAVHQEKHMDHVLKKLIPLASSQRPFA